MATLIQITDTHQLASAGREFYGLDPAATLAAVIAAARAAHGDIELVVASGDIAQEAVPASYAAFCDAVAVFDCPVLCLPGNHDDPDMMRASFAGTCCRLADAAQWQGRQLLLLDTSVPGFKAGVLAPAVLAGLPDRLATMQPVIIFLHHHPLPVGSAWMDRIGLHNGAALAAVLAGRDNIEAVVCGHVHQAGSAPFASSTCYWTPSTCNQFLPGAVEFACDERPPAWRWFRVTPGGALETGVSWLAAPGTGRARDAAIAEAGCC